VDGFTGHYYVASSFARLFARVNLANDDFRCKAKMQSLLQALQKALQMAAHGQAGRRGPVSQNFVPHPPHIIRPSPITH
jgi:hypothetical protein